MYSLELPWKEFSVSLAVVGAWMTTNVPETYAGCTADYTLTLWFTSLISDEQKADVLAYWDAVTLESSEATSYVSQAEIGDAIADLRATMITKSWDELTIAERKLLMNQQPTLEELGLA